MKLIKSFFKIALCGILISVFSSCSVKIVENETSNDIAEAYLDNKILLEKYSNENRSLEAREYPSFVYELVIYDDEKIVSFEELTSKKQEEFYKNWKVSYIETIREKIETVPGLAEAIEKDNAAMQKVIKSAERKVIPLDAESLFAEYGKELKKCILMKITIHEKQKVKIINMN